MSEFITEMRTYVGQPGSVAVDGYTEFYLGQRYAITYCRRSDETVVLRLTHGSYKGTAYLYINWYRFQQWWVLQESPVSSLATGG
jgi:hypothetical protein